MPSRSEARRVRATIASHRILWLVIVVAAAVVATAGVALADVINTGRFVIAEDAVQDEDAYVAATTGRVDGRIEGDLVIATESLQISGVVTGDVLVAARGTVEVDGTIEGSLRGIARRVVLRGEVGDDVGIVTANLDLAGRVGRDVIGLGGWASIEGAVGRDVRGRFVSASVVGNVGRDVEVTIDTIEIESGAVVGGDVVYQAVDAAEIATGAAIGGQLIQLPTDAPFFAGLVLTVASVVGFLGYVLGGIALLWALRASAARAIAAVTLQPLRTLGVGAAAIVVGPLVVVLTAATLVGLPLALVMLGIVLIGAFFGSVPLVAAVGMRLLGGRGGSFGGFILVAVVGRLLAALWSPLGAAIYLVALVWGVGGWLTGAWRTRSMTVASISS